MSKELTIPKAELEAALMLTKLMTRICNIFQHDINQTLLFSDAKIILCWLNKLPEKWTPYVNNRVRKITELASPKQWFYVNTKENPADLATRGLSADIFLNQNAKFWFQGPNFLRDEEELEQHMSCCSHTSLASSFTAVAREATTNEYKVISRFSSYNRLISTFARIFLMLRKGSNSAPTLTSTDARSKALTYVTKVVQRRYFKTEIEALQSSKNLKKGPLRLLLPFCDSEGILRVRPTHECAIL